MTKTGYLSFLLCLSISGCSYIPWFGSGTAGKDKHIVAGPPDADRSIDYWCDGAGQRTWNCVEGNATSRPKRATPGTQPSAIVEPQASIDEKPAESTMAIGAEPAAPAAVEEVAVVVAEAVAIQDMPAVVPEAPLSATANSELKLFSSVPNEHFAIQLMAAEYLGQAEVYVENRNLAEAEIVPINTASGDWYVVILDYFPDRVSAQVRAEEYVRSNPDESPWVRGTADLREAYRLGQAAE